jgi:hypothetical protein
MGEHPSVVRLIAGLQRQGNRSRTWPLGCNLARGRGLDRSPAGRGPQSDSWGTVGGWSEGDMGQ